MSVVTALDRPLSRLGTIGVMLLALAGVALIGMIDYVTGYEVSVSEFYLLPLTVAAWYKGRLAAVIIAALCCTSWYVADTAAGRPAGDEAVAVWNTVVRLVFLVVTGVLLDALRTSFDAQRRLARTDGLTGLLVRRAFNDQLQRTLALARRHGDPITLAYIDVDDFKLLNDSRGHAEGDRLLWSIGDVLARSLRTSDAAGRLGGDEFALILPRTDAGGARQLVNRLNATLHQTFATNDWDVGCSIGVVTLRNTGMYPEAALTTADALMYDVKRQGKGTVAFRVLDGRDVRPTHIHTARSACQ
ncbi:GGDEF domain-containing protein [Arhodomonas aquaeolei]|uniref:GGDEF domain-containing protein n=1 Tax=Arhodomonas aquaeolei TaxID=2369 RepID=UPI000363F864|nr:GGDEF domain-containing protein [Arhodomonas aquaeolei]